MATEVSCCDLADERTATLAAPSLDESAERLTRVFDLVGRRPGGWARKEAGTGYPQRMIRRALWQGLVAGTVGGVVMTLGEKIEQAVTGRPDSHVPARVLQRLAGLPERPGAQQPPVNWAMHYGQAALLGVLRSIMAQAGLRGPLASAKFTVVRLTNDQILENATGVGAPPSTWPRGEIVLDVLHKAVYAFTTGAVADALADRGGPGPGQEHAALRPGRRPDVGPLPRRDAHGR
ncbi:hypothetical protein ABZ079_33505 [Streptomyces sp. NPDC006314]|uniref:hypothetical protein n=1 Tax=Streptomyces sp. NPDC006314 TaxID=3154475 RepID=UPI00339DB2BD